MARISSYPFDTVISDNDAWIGTEATNRLTRQFTASAVANYLNLNAKVNIGQILKTAVLALYLKQVVVDLVLTLII